MPLPDDFNVWEFSNDAHKAVICGYLGCSPDEVTGEFDQFYDEPQEEPWEDPPGFVVELEMDNVQQPGMFHGDMFFGTCKGQKLVTSCAASPLLFYSKKK